MRDHRPRRTRHTPPRLATSVRTMRIAATPTSAREPASPISQISRWVIFVRNLMAGRGRHIAESPNMSDLTMTGPSDLTVCLGRSCRA